MKSRCSGFSLGRFAPALLLALLIDLPANATVSASLDSDQIASGDTVELTLEQSGQSGGEPDLTPLKQNFDILGTQRSTNIQIINGHTSAGTSVVVTLSPKSTGRLTLPSIQWGSDRSPVLTLDVSSAAGGTNGASDSGSSAPTAKAFIETQVDQKQPYVQAAVDVTVRLYTAEQLRQANLELPTTSDALVMKVGSDSNSTADRNGVTYQVVTRHYAVFPQHSGAVSLPGPVLDAEVIVRRSRSNMLGADPLQGFFANSPFAGLLNTTKPLRLHGDPIVLTVRPRPAASTSSYWIPAREVTLTAQWNPTQLRVHAGDPLTVDLQLQAQGLTAGQLPDLAALLALPQGVKAYPDQPKLDDSTQGDTVTGKRRQSVALIADQPGRLTLPAVHLQWWDVKANQPREATLPEQTIMVLPAANGGANATANAPGDIQLAPASPTRNKQDGGATITNSSTPANRATNTQAPSTVGGSALGNGSGGRAISHDGRNTTYPATLWHNTSIWRWATLGALILWLATALAWFLSRKRSAPASMAHEAPPTSKPDTSSARAAFRKACNDNDAPAARRSLIQWAAASRPGTTPTGLTEIARASADPNVSILLRELDRACFAGTPWQGEALARTLKDLPQLSKSAPKRRAGLAPLYH